MSLFIPKPDAFGRTGPCLLSCQAA